MIVHARKYEKRQFLFDNNMYYLYSTDRHSDLMSLNTFPINTSKKILKKLLYSICCIIQILFNTV